MQRSSQIRKRGRIKVEVGPRTQQADPPYKYVCCELISKLDVGTITLDAQ